MIIFRPFKVGDYIEGAGVAGTVESIQIFTTQLKTKVKKAFDAQGITNPFPQRDVHIYEQKTDAM